MFLKNWNLAQAEGSILLHLDSIPLLCIYVYIIILYIYIYILYHVCFFTPSEKIPIATSWYDAGRKRQLPATSYISLKCASGWLRCFLLRPTGCMDRFPMEGTPWQPNPLQQPGENSAPRKSQTGNEDHNLGLRDTQVKSVRKLQVLYLNIPQLLCASQVDPG